MTIPISWVVPFINQPYRDQWAYNWLGVCWKHGCTESVPKEDPLGLCSDHIEELREFSKG